MELLLIRHLPTEWNKRGILQGSKDIPILPLQVKDAIKIDKNIQIIAEFDPVLIVASELKRTQHTAFEYGFIPKIEPLLNELNFGDYEGLAKTKLMEVKEWISDPRTLTLGEPLLDFENRIIQFIEKYKLYSRLVVFGHGSWIRGLLSISSVGTIQNMNEVQVENNQLIKIRFS